MYLNYLKFIWKKGSINFLANASDLEKKPHHHLIQESASNIWTSPQSQSIISKSWMKILRRNNAFAKIRNLSFSNLHKIKVQSQVCPRMRKSNHEVNRVFLPPPALTVKKKLMREKLLIYKKGYMVRKVKPDGPHTRRSSLKSFLWFVASCFLATHMVIQKGFHSNNQI